MERHHNDDDGRPVRLYSIEILEIHLLDHRLRAGDTESRIRTKLNFCGRGWQLRPSLARIIHDS